MRLGQHFLDHQRVDVDHAVLDQVQREHADLVVLAAVAGHLAAAGEEHEIVAPFHCSTTFRPSWISRRSSFDMQIPAEEDRLDGLAQFGEGLVGRVLHVVLGEAAQDRFRFGRAQAKRRGVLDHLVVLLPDQLPVDRLRQDRLQVRIGIGLAGFRAVQLLRVDGFQPWQQLEAEQPAEGKGDRALAVGIDVLSIDLHLGAVMDHALDHRSHFRRGRRLELRMDAQRVSLDVPVDHDAATAVAHVPLRGEILIPGAEVLGVGGASGGAVPQMAGLRACSVPSATIAMARRSVSTLM